MGLTGSEIEEKKVARKKTQLDVMLVLYIRNLTVYISLLGFIEGFFDGKDLLYYFAYNSTYKLSLFKYQTIKTIIVIPTFL